MAASYRHRKLLVNLNPSNDTALYPFCLYDCNPEVNPAGICSADCSLYCPNFCRPFEPSSPTPAPTISPHAITPPDHHNLLLSLPLKISLIFLTATFVYTVYKFYTVWYRSGTSRPQPPSSPENENFEEQNVLDHPIWYIRTVGLPAAVINALTVVNFSKIDGTVEGSDCSVCLTEFEEDDTLRLLPNCKHAFHVRCIDTWLRSHTNCPLCRAVIVENNNNNTTSLEQNDGGLGETNLGVSDGDRGEASGSSGLDEDLFKIEGNGAL